MRDYRANEIRNVTVLGHSGSGKTSLLEAMYVYTKVIDHRGKTSEGSSVLDTDKEEIRRGQTIYTKLAPIEWKGCKLNFLDTPGYLDFLGETLTGIEMGDNALLVVSAKDGVESSTLKFYQLVKQRNEPVLFFINKIDEEHASFDQTYEDLRQAFGKQVIAFEVPILEAGRAIGSVNVLRKKAWYSNDREHPQKVPEAMRAQVDELYQQIQEAVALTQESLLEKFLAGEAYSEDEMLKGVCAGVRSGELCPVYCGSAVEMTGIERLLDLLVEYFPSYAEKGEVSATGADGQTVWLQTSESEIFSAQVMKTVVDPYVGKISYLKVLSGTLSSDSTVYNSSRDVLEKVTQLFGIQGKYQFGVGKLFTGDIGATLKLQSTQTNDTLTVKGEMLTYAPLMSPQGLYGVAVWPKTKADEDKMSQAFQRLMEEDASIRFEKNGETGEFVLWALGDQQIDVIINRLRSKYKLELTITEPRIAYRETIGATAEAEGKHKKQTGGAGQYGDVFIRFEPNDCEDMVFESKVVGGAVPKQFFPAVEAGLRECMNKGILAGFKVVGVKATLYDGKYHEVDSKEVAFKAAARLAYLEGMPKARPILLEPIVSVDVRIPEAYTGTIIGDLNKRRGIILGIDGTDDEQIIHAEVPQSEVTTYALDLRALSQGRGEYNQGFLRYDPLPEALSGKVIEQARKEE